MLDLRGISFQWPWLLLGLLLVPLSAWVWYRYRSPNGDLALRYPGLAGNQGSDNAPVWPRRLSIVLFLLGLSLLLTALARPSSLFALPLRQLDLILAIDTSGSMRADDIKPTRLAAAKNMLYPFIEALPAHVRVGLVSVAATASLAQSPTRDREALRQALERLEAQRGTALGSGIVIALSTLRPDANLDVEKLTTGRSSRGWGQDPSKAEQKPPEPVPAGSNDTMAVVLVSDGKTTVGIDTKEAAKLAADLGVRIYTVGVGTSKGAILKVDGVNQRVRLEDEAMRETAKLTLGEYFDAAKPADLEKITNTLKSRLILQKPRQTEITGVFAGIGTLLLLTAVLISLFTRQRIL